MPPVDTMRPYAKDSRPRQTTLATMDPEEIEISEMSPLLGRQVRLSTTRVLGRRKQPWIASFVNIAPFAAKVPQIHDPATILWTSCAIVFVFQAAGSFLDIPLIKVLEGIVCRNYYKVDNPSQPIDEALCRADGVQAKLAFLFAVNSSLDAGLSGLLALVWGIAADRMGRKPVFLLAVIGSTANVAWILTVAWIQPLVPIQLIWISSAGCLIGGGGAMLTAIFFSMLTDVLPESERAIGFMRVHVASMLGSAIAPTLASSLMPRWGPWPLLSLGLVVMPLSGVAFLCFPETLHRKEAPSDGCGAQDMGTWAKLWGHLAELRSSLTMFKTASLLLLVGTHFTSVPIIICTSKILSLYVSKRYGIKVEETGYVQTAYGIAHVAAVLVVLPFVSDYVRKPTAPRLLRVGSDRRRDLMLARWSFSVAGVGALTLAFAPSVGGFIAGLVVLALGSGASSLVRSCMSIYVGPAQVARLYTMDSVVQSAGILYAEPLLAGLYSQGMRVGGALRGLLYLGVGLLALATTGLLLLVRLPGMAKEDEELLARGSEGVPALHGQDSDRAQSAETAAALPLRVDRSRGPAR